MHGLFLAALTVTIYYRPVRGLSCCIVLFARSRLIGLLLAVVIYTNIIIMDVAFEVPALLHATVEFAIVILLLIPYLPHLKKFFWDMGGKIGPLYQKSRLSVFPVVFLMLGTMGVTYLIKMNSRRDDLNGSYKISSLVLKNDTLAIGQGKYTKDPMLFFEFSNVCILTLNDSTYYGKYSIGGGEH